MKRLSRILPFVLAAVLVAVPFFGQAQNGTIAGRVRRQRRQNPVGGRDDRDRSIGDQQRSSPVCVSALHNQDRTRRAVQPDGTLYRPRASQRGRQRPSAS